MDVLSGNQHNYGRSLIRQVKTDYHDRICTKINTDTDRTCKEWWRLCKSVSFKKNLRNTLSHHFSIMKSFYTTIDIKHMLLMNTLLPYQMSTPTTYR